METAKITNYSAHCLKCKGVKPLKEAQIHESKNKRLRVAGKCAECNGNVSTFAKSANLPAPRDADEEDYSIHESG